MKVVLKIFLVAALLWLGIRVVQKGDFISVKREVTSLFAKVKTDLRKEVDRLKK